MINRILHSWSFNMKCVKLVGQFRYFARQGSQNTEITQTRFINFILNNHECKIFYIYTDAAGDIEI